MNRGSKACCAVLIALGALVAGTSGAPAKTATENGPGAGAAARVGINCLNSAGNRYRRKVEPKSCAGFGPNAAFAGGVNLKQLDWTNWGKRRATATGIDCGFHLPCANGAVTVTAYRRRKGCRSRVYTRLKYDVQGYHPRVRLPKCGRKV